MVIQGKNLISLYILPDQRRVNLLVITKPHKRSGVVLLNKSDYVDKMNEILDEKSKFKRLGPVSSNDNTASIESRLQKR